MLRPLLVCFITAALTVGVNAQRRDNTIEMRRSVFGAPYFYRNGERLAVNRVGRYLAEQPEAVRCWKLARRNKTIGDIIGTAGGFLLGYAVGEALAGGKPATSLLVVGGGLTALSIPLGISFKQKAAVAVDLYNEQATGIGSQTSGRPTLHGGVRGLRLAIPPGH